VPTLRARRSLADADVIHVIVIAVGPVGGRGGIAAGVRTGDDAGEYTAGNVSFYIGAGADPSTATGGTLVSGDQATVTFAVEVE
jgi:hypothetical protein